MIIKKQAEINATIETIAAIIASNFTATDEPTPPKDEPTPPKKIKYPLDQKEPKNYPKPKGRDQRWR